MKHLLIQSILATVIALAASTRLTANPITPQGFKDKTKTLSSYAIFDIRDPSSFYKGHLYNSVNIEWKSGTLDSKYQDYSGTTTIFVVCQDGTSSKDAVAFLKAAGYTKAYYIEGGIDACTNVLPILSEQDRVTTWGVIKSLFGGKVVPRNKGG